MKTINNPLRILHIVTYMGRGGLETMLMNYYRYIDREKIQFDFLTHRDLEADYDQEILALGGKIYHVSRLVPWSKSYKSELRKFFNEHSEYKIVHVHQDCLSSVALQSAKECGVPIRIAHSHNNSQDKNLKYLIKRHYMRTIPIYATSLFACCKSAGEWMFGDQKYQILPNAIDVGRFEYSKRVASRMRESLGVGNSILIGHVGSFKPQKNHGFLIEIFSRIVSINSETRLLLVGDGGEMPKIRKQTKMKGLEDKVIFAGSRDDVSELMQAMDVFVLPSLYEGLPVVAIEAQAAGLPCVVSDGVPEECNVTEGLVTCKKLCESPEDWAKHILTQAGKTRRSHMTEIQAAGYDVVDAAAKLETFYFEAAARG
ncbi:MAG: glycosyltransferase family 1 protein [Clostridiales bacterium]|nr:glycosyltransferase family 1 protein [Clostridiales bacterium]